MRIAPHLNGFTDELRKIAASSAPDHERDRVRRMAGGAAVPGIGILASSAFTGKGIDRDANPKHDHARARQVQRGMGLEGVPTHVGIGDPGVDVRHGMLALDQQPHTGAPPQIVPYPERIKNVPGMDVYAEHGPKGPARYLVQVPHQSAEAATAHEFGHVANHSRWSKGFSRLSDLSRKVINGKVGGFRSGAVPIAASAWAAGTDEPTWAPGIANAALAAPMLADEAAASGRALKYMTKQHGLAKGLWKSKALAPALGGYAALGLSPLAITGARKAWKKHKEKKAGAGMAGALMGGGLGMMMPGKYKAHAAIGGALVGGLAGKAIGGVGHAIHKDNHRLNALAAQQPPGDPNYVPTWQQGYR